MDCQIELPFPTMGIKNRRYKVFGMVTNMDWEGERLIHWLHERCGKSFFLQLQIVYCIMLMYYIYE